MYAFCVAIYCTWQPIWLCLSCTQFYPNSGTALRSIKYISPPVLCSCTGSTIPNVFVPLIQGLLQVDICTGNMMPGRAGFTAHGATIRPNMFITYSTGDKPRLYRVNHKGWDLKTTWNCLNLTILRLNETLNMPFLHQLFHD